MNIHIQLLEHVENAPFSLLAMAEPSKLKIDDYLRRGYCYTASQNGQIIGVYILLRTLADTLEIVNIAVSKTHQGQGIGKQMITEIINKAKEWKMKTIEIGTGNSSLDALALYQKCGFRIVAIIPNYFLHHYEEKIHENGMLCCDMIRLRLNI